MTAWMANVASHFRHDGTTKAHKITEDISSSNTPSCLDFHSICSPTPYVSENFQKLICLGCVDFFGIILQYVSFIFNNVTVLFNKETLLIKLVEMPYGF